MKKIKAWYKRFVASITPCEMELNGFKCNQNCPQHHPENLSVSKQGGNKNPRKDTMIKVVPKVARVKTKTVKVSK